MKQYKAKCHTCGKILKDPNPDGPDPIYIPYARMSRDGNMIDEYCCDDKCKEKEVAGGCSHF